MSVNNVVLNGAKLMEQVARRVDEPKRRREILAEAGRMFLEKGLQATTMRELARALDLDAGSLYRYFPSKGGIFAAMAKETNEHIACVLDAAIKNASDADDVVHLAFAQYVKLVDRYSDYYRLFYRCFDGLPRDLWGVLLDGERGVVGVFEGLLKENGFSSEDAHTLAWDIVLLGEMWAIKRWAFERSMDVETFIATQWRVASAAMAAFGGSSVSKSGGVEA